MAILKESTRQKKSLFLVKASALSYGHKKNIFLQEFCLFSFVRDTTEIQQGYTHTHTHTWTMRREKGTTRRSLSRSGFMIVVLFTSNSQLELSFLSLKPLTDRDPV